MGQLANEVGLPGAVPKRTRKSSNGFGQWLVAPLIVFLFAMTVFPTIYCLWISLTNLQMGTSGTGQFVGLENYAEDLFHSSLFLNSLLLSGVFVIVALPCQFILGYFVARVFYAVHDMRGVILFRTLYLLPVMITSLSVGLFWDYILDPMVGVMNSLLSIFHLPPQSWLANPNAALPTIIGIYLWQWTPFTSMLLLAGMLGIPEDLYEAAYIDGMGYWRRIISFDVPLLRRVGSVAAILSIVQIMQTFDLIYATTTGGPGTSTMVNAFAIYRQGFNFFQTGKAAEEAVVVLIITILLSQIFARTAFSGGDRE
ncbi:MAG: sugar ABC transporter permease [Alicyclobacillus sp.]|nr:sugar ABC transporter permease [Alicyclobacillus sp.]